jgi:hypothetical protein
MKRTNAQALSEVFTQFQVELQRMALQIVDDVMRREAERQRARAPKRKPALPAKAERKRGRKAGSSRKEPAGRKAGAGRKEPASRKEPAGRKPRRGRRSSGVQLELVPTELAAAPEVTTGEAAPTATEQQGTASTPSAVGGKRRQWTRENIVEELANWLVNGNAVDASFVTRHGPPGLAAAARRIFGRFDAALNVAGLHVAKLYPDGPPPKRGAAAAAAVSRKQPSAPAPKAEEAS